jgi:hypothetical protein
LMPRHFYLVAVPVLAFMVMLMLNGRSEAFSSVPCFCLGAPDD